MRFTYIIIIMCHTGNIEHWKYTTGLHIFHSIFSALYCSTELMIILFLEYIIVIYISFLNELEVF